jgi:hypothetical protein
MFGEDSRPEDETSYDLAHALDGNRAYDSAAVGWNYRTTELSAAVARDSCGASSTGTPRRSPAPRS